MGCMLTVIVGIPVFVFLAAFVALKYFQRQCHLARTRRERPTVGFFHPYCNSGGGGERVLWCAVRSFQKRYQNYDVVVYTGDTNASPEEILGKASNRFGIKLEDDVKFVYLQRRRWVEAERYPYLTMLGQSLGGLVLALEGLRQFVPDLFIDTMGYPFSLPVFRIIGKCQVACYVHYPVISSDMLKVVSSRSVTYNNRFRGLVFSRLKLVYYRLFAKLYALLGKASQATMVNSTWTYDHIVEIWKEPSKTSIVYPPCDVDSFLDLEVQSEGLDAIRILSVGQFRPEKDHSLQLKAFKNLISQYQSKNHSDMGRKPLKLILAGSCRHSEDAERVEKLKALADQLGINHSVEWRLNISFEELKSELSRAMIGLHTMWNEHFGIGIVEGIASGNIMVAHNSGGPRADILRSTDMGETVGFLAASEEEYAVQMLEIISKSKSERDDIRRFARIRAREFDETVFERAFLKVIAPIVSENLS